MKRLMFLVVFLALLGCQQDGDGNGQDGDGIPQEPSIELVKGSDLSVEIKVPESGFYYAELWNWKWVWPKPQDPTTWYPDSTSNNLLVYIDSFYYKVWETSPRGHYWAKLYNETGDSLLDVFSDTLVYGYNIPPVANFGMIVDYDWNYPYSSVEVWCHDSSSNMEVLVCDPGTTDYCTMQTDGPDGYHISYDRYSLDHDTTYTITWWIVNVSGWDTAQKAVFVPKWGPP